MHSNKTEINLNYFRLFFVRLPFFEFWAECNFLNLFFFYMNDINHLPTSGVNKCICYSFYSSVSN